MRCGFVRPQRHGRPEPARPDLSNAPAWLLPSLQVKPLSRHLTHQNTVTHSQAPSPKLGRVFIYTPWDRHKIWYAQAHTQARPTD